MLLSLKGTKSCKVYVFWAPFTLRYDMSYLINFLLDLTPLICFLCNLKLVLALIYKSGELYKVSNLGSLD